MLNLKPTTKHIAMNNLLFLLGGHDLEMLTIRNLLDSKGQQYVDKHLSWGARLSEYKSELAQYGDDSNYIIYGIELDEVGFSHIPTNYQAIDHHNEREAEPSSLEQVCAILGIEMDEHLLLVAANDKGYIPAMEKMGATKERIKEIRREDRMAQGGTALDEQLAEEAISSLETIGEIIFVKSETSHFSAICDRLYPYEKLLVYTDTEFVYFGKDKDILKSEIEARYNKIPKLYSGGGIEGYFGYKALVESDEVLCKDIVNYIKGQQSIVQPYSGHIFLFPFTWDDGNVDAPLKNLIPVNNGNWERMPLPNSVEEDALFNELNYFYPFTHDTLYDQEGSGSRIWHFERKETRGQEQVKYEIVIEKEEEKEKKYILDVKYLNLNLYETGVGLLSIYTQNTYYPHEEDILSINQFGRRLFPPFKKDIDYHTEVAFSLELLGLEGEERYYEEFMNKDIQPNSPAGFITKLVKDAISNIGDIKPVLDDRMFVMSWYKSPIPFTFESVYARQSRGIDDYLYRFIFVDAGAPTCQNKEMRQALLREAVYPRWQQWGTLYGISRYSFQMLFSGNAPEHLIQTFETEYVRLVELVLVQRATILRFSGLLKIYGEKIDSFNVVYGQYINFLNRFRFPEITAQEQGIELYDMLCKILRIQEQAEHLDKQFNEREEYLELVNQKNLDRTTTKLNILAGIAVPVSIISAVFGLFFRDEFHPHEWDSSWPGIVALLLSLIGTWVAMALINKGNKTKCFKKRK